MMQALHTDTLRLVPLQAEHAEVMFELLSDPAIYRYLDYAPPASVEALREHYRHLESRCSPDGAEGWLNWIVFAKATNQALGFVQATVMADGRAWVGYEFGSAHWGRGHAFAAMSAMLAELAARYGVRHCLACVERENLRSIRLLERLAFSASSDDAAAGHLSASELLYKRAL